MTQIKLIERYTEKEKEILRYCKGFVEYMWAASIAAIILDCEFRDVPAKILEVDL